MPITRENVKQVAMLSRIRLREDELDLFAGHLTKIVGYVDQLKELDTDNVAPTTHVLLLKDVYREDAVKVSLRRKDVLFNAPSSDEEFVKVPRIIEGSE